VLLQLDSARGDGEASAVERSNEDCGERLQMHHAVASWDEPWSLEDFDRGHQNQRA